MQVLLINPDKKKSKKSKRGAKMAKKKTKTKKTKAKKTTRRTAKHTIKRRKIRTRRNPSMNPLVAYAIGGFTGLTTSKLIDSIKPITLPFGVTGGNLISAGIGYMMYKKGSGAVRQIGTGHLASAIGLITVNLLDGLTGGKVLKGGLHDLDELNEYVMYEPIPEGQVLDGIEEIEEPEGVQVLA